MFNSKLNGRKLGFNTPFNSIGLSVVSHRREEWIGRVFIAPSG